MRPKRHLAYAWIAATLLSGIPSTLFALATGGDPMEATRAAGAMVGRPHSIAERSLKLARDAAFREPRLAGRLFQGSVDGLGIDGTNGHESAHDVSRTVEHIVSFTTRSMRHGARLSI